LYPFHFGAQGRNFSDDALKLCGRLLLLLLLLLLQLPVLHL
jgi:hypothetical protein